MAWYDTGTVNVTNGSTTVVGVGTNFIAGAQVGEGFYGPDNRLYEIQAIVSATSLTLADVYLGTTQTGQGYKIVPTQSLTADLTTQVAALISDFQTVADEAGAGKFNDGTAASPAITFTQDQDNGFYRPAANQIGFATGGAQRLLLSNTALTSSVPFSGTNGTFTGDVTIGDDLFLTGPTPVIRLTDNDIADEYTDIYNSGGNTTIDSRNGASNGLLLFRGTGGGVATEYARFNTLGNFGVNEAAPLARLHVNSGPYDTMAIFESEDRYGTMKLRDSTSTASTGGVTLGVDGDALYVQTGSVNSNAMRIDSSGNVGIGTSSPSGLLELSAGTGSGTLSIVSTQNQANAGNKIAFFAADRSDADEEMAYIQPLLVGNSGGTGNVQTGHLAFGTSGLERIRISSIGNVGIANNDPQALLYVGGNSTSLGGAAGDDINLLTLEAKTFHSDRLLFTCERLTTGTEWTTAAHRIQRTVNSTSMGYMQFGNNTSDLITFGENDTEYMRIDGGGTVSIGTTSTIYNDTTGKQGFVLGQTGTMQSSKSNGASFLINRQGSNGSVQSFYKAGVVVGSISVADSATAFNTTSDYRTKENVTPVQGATDIVKAMRPVTYTAKADGLWYDGFLAHELQEVHPRAVTGTKDAMMDEEYEITPAVYEDVVTTAAEAVAATYDDEGIELTPAVEATPETTESVLVTEAVMGTRSVPDMQSVDYSKLTPILTAALQEALAKIDALEVRLAALESA